MLTLPPDKVLALAAAAATTVPVSALPSSNTRTVWPTSAVVVPLSTHLAEPSMAWSSDRLSVSSPSAPTPAPSVSWALPASVGATVSMRTLRVLPVCAGELLPAVSVTVTLTLEEASPVGTSLLANATCQPPPLCTVVVLAVLPQVTLTTSPVAAPVLVPLSSTPPSCSLWLTTSSPATTSMLAEGALVSIATACSKLASAERLPAASLWRARIAPLAYAPSLRVKLLLVPARQLAPASTLYCQVPLVSKPLSVIKALLLTPSLLLVPLSLKTKLGACGAAVSTCTLGAPTRSRSSPPTLAPALALALPALPASSRHAPTRQPKLPCKLALGVRVAV